MDLPNASVRRTSRRGPVIAAILSFAFALGVLLLSGLPEEPGRVLMLLSGLGAAFSAFVAYLFTFHVAPSWLGRGNVTLDERGVSLNGRLAVARADVRSAIAMPMPNGAIVELDRGFVKGRAQIEASSIGEARAGLEALGFDPSHRTASFWVRGASVGQFKLVAWLRFLMGIPIALGMVIGDAHKSPGLMFAVLALGLLGFALVGNSAVARVVVGADGVLVRSAFGSEFHRLADIASAEVVERGQTRANQIPTLIRLQLRGGRTVVLVSGITNAGRWGADNPVGVAHEVARATMIVERIREAIGQSREGNVVASTAALARAQRDVGAWIRELRALAESAQTFRREELPSPRDLLSIVEDPNAAEETRAAAAVALAPQVDEEGRARVRVAAAATAAPKLRVALEASLAADDEALAAALEEIGSAAS